MNKSNFRHRIDVYGKTKTTNELKETTYLNSKISTVWAEIMPQTGKLQNQQVETVLTQVTHKIIIRYNRQIVQAYQNEQTKNSMYILFKGHRFNIKFILNPYFRNEKLEIFVEEVIG
jgi:SPP1 family predicted phage head-tail adaptor